MNTPLWILAVTSIIGSCNVVLGWYDRYKARQRAQEFLAQVISGRFMPGTVTNDDQGGPLAS